MVDTIGFPRGTWDHGHPGRRISHEKSRLVERVPLLKDGALLSVTFTWTDPTVFRTPHWYRIDIAAPANYEPGKG